MYLSCCSPGFHFSNGVTLTHAIVSAILSIPCCVSCCSEATGEPGTMGGIGGIASTEQRVTGGG